MGVQAAVYLRISQDATGEGLGVSRQREDCLALCKREGWDVVEIYTDNDISAYKARPGFKRMVDDVKAGRIEAIVTWQPDRLYRTFTDLQVLVDVIEAHSIVVHTVKAGDLNLDSAYGRMVARMLSVIAMGEGELKAERWRRSWRQAREAGVSARTGTRMFGYTHEGDLIPDEAEVARRMADDIIDGIPILTIARRLEAEGILTTRDTVWRPGTVRQYLANPRIAGYSTLKGEIVADGTWEAILDRETWEMVRALLNGRARGTYPRKAILTGLLFCGACGQRMITSGAGGKRTYRCPKRPGMPGCGSVSGNAEPIEQIVETYAQTRLEDPRVRQAIQRRTAMGAPEALAEIDDIETRIRELEAGLDKPGVPVDTILRAIDRAKERLRECQEKLAAAVPVSVPASGGAWPDDLERRRRLIDLVVERVELHPSTKRVRYFDATRVTILPR